MGKIYRFAFLLSFMFILTACADDALTAEQHVHQLEEHEKNGWHPYCVDDGECASGVDLRIPQTTQETFPKVRNWNSVQIVLDHSGCNMAGVCLGYQVDVYGDGKVIFIGRWLTAAAGRHTYYVSRSTVKKIVTILRNINFYALHDDPHFGVCNDCTITSTSISINSQTRTIDDHRALPWNAQKNLRKANEKILKLLHVDSWVLAGPSFVDDLKKEKYDFKSRKADDIIFILAVWGKLETLKTFLNAGAEIRNDNTTRLALDLMKKEMFNDPREQDVYPKIIDMFEKAGVGPLQPDDHTWP